jgi:hypothetical protein
LKEKLDMAILNDKKCKNKGRLNVSKDSSKIIRKEIAVFEKEGNSWNILAKLLRILENYKANKCRIGAWIFGKWQLCHQITIIS